jgi:hypothetical protein
LVCGGLLGGSNCTEYFNSTWQDYNQLTYPRSFAAVTPVNWFSKSVWKPSFPSINKHINLSQNGK